MEPVFIAIMVNIFWVASDIALLIHNNKFINIDTASESSTDSDFWWETVGGTDNLLAPMNGARYYLYPDYDAANYAVLSAATYQSKKVAGDWLNYQLIFCRTSSGRYSKLLCSVNSSLTIHNLDVFNADGSLFLHKNNIVVSPSFSVDLDTGTVTTASCDFWWHGVTPTEFYLEPQNGAKISFDSYYAYEKYLPLLATSAIRNAMVISGSSNRNYDSWTEIEKLQLREFVNLTEKSQPLPIAGPPALTGDQFISDCDALKIYMAHLAQCLWVDANNKVSWKLNTASANHLTYLFDMRKLLAWTAANGYSFSYDVMGAVTDWSPGYSYNFLLSNGFIKATKWDTIKALAEWCRANLVHISGAQYDINGPFANDQDQQQFYFNYRGLPPVDKMIDPLPGKQHITHGCWGTDGFFAAVLRSVNIPVKHGRSVFDSSSHSRAEFFTEGKNLSHGDDIYNAWIQTGVNTVPVEKIFMTDAEITSLIDAPAPLPGKTAGQTANYNHMKRLVALAITYKTNYLLKFRCQDKASGVPLHSSKIWENLHDFYTDAEITGFIPAMDTAIAAIPGGCGGF